MLNSSKIPVIIDTDVFGDSDDLLAICYLLAHQDQIDLKLIVTADEYRGLRAAWMQRVLAEVGVAVPVVAGKDLGNTRLFLFDEIQTNDVDFDFLEAIHRVVVAHDTVHFLCLAPQSNLAAFLTAFPDLKGKLKVRAMGGALDLDLGRVEHNVRTDIEAFKLVTEKTSQQLLLADHTWHDSMQFHPQTEIFKLLEKSSHPLARAVIQNARAFFDRLYPQSRFHDPILVSTLWADFIKFAPAEIVIELDGSTRRPGVGETGQSVSVSTSVDYKNFYQDFLASLKTYLSE